MVTLRRYKTTNQRMHPSPRASLGQWMPICSDRVILAVRRLKSIALPTQNEVVNMNEPNTEGRRPWIMGWHLLTFDRSLDCLRNARTEFSSK